MSNNHITGKSMRCAARTRRGAVTEQIQHGPGLRRNACNNQVTLEKQGGFIWQLLLREETLLFHLP